MKDDLKRNSIPYQSQSNNFQLGNTAGLNSTAALPLFPSPTPHVNHRQEKKKKTSFLQIENKIQNLFRPNFFTELEHAQES